MFDQWNDVRRLLLVFEGRGTRALDNLQPALSHLRQRLPAVQLTVWFAPELREVAGSLPGIDALLALGDPWIDEAEQAIDTIRDGQFDVALILSAPGASPYGAAYACYLAGVPVRLGQSVEFGGAVLSHRLTPPSPAVPPTAHYLHLVSQLVR